ncbi:MAG: CinA family protein [Geobacter sp.]|jgi:PncC family amidohydrolase|nr:CinA family protein [Geobacter sp.]
MIELEELHLLFCGYGLTLAVAESCTAGLAAARIADQPGCSGWFRGGVVAYHNEVKHQLLGVPWELLHQHGAVSEPVACAMATGVRLACRADLGLAITGIAGPNGGSSDKPVGTVYLALADDDGSEAIRCQFDGDRISVRQQSVEQALLMLKTRLMASETA